MVKIEMLEMFFIRLGFSQVVAQELVEDQGIDYSGTLANLSDEDFTAICDVI